MDNQELIQTAIWELYEKGRNFHRRVGIYADTDRNYRMYNGNQWEGLKLGEGIEPVQNNFIKPIVKYKIAVIHDNLYAIHYSSQNYKNKAFREQAEKICDMLNNYAGRVWEKDKMDFKGRSITKDSAINDEGIIYTDFDIETMYPVNEVVNKNDIYYGNENDNDIQAQPYILYRKRMAVSNAVEFALSKGASYEDTRSIVGDDDKFDQSGEAAKEELDNGVTVVYKFYKKGGTVHFSIATRYCDICEDIDTGIKLYPFAHFIWEEKKGSARGEGEVRYLIPNQIEVNRTEMRRVLTVKTQAYPRLVAATERITNPNELNKFGSIIKIGGNTVEDVNKIVGTLQPAQMSTDVKQLLDDLIQKSRDLAGAGDTATGQVDPESASGRAILAVQQASQAPMTEQKESYKNFVEDIARIWLEYLIVHSDNGVDLEYKVTDQMTGQETVEIVNVPQSALQQLQADVKIDVTPKGVYDKYAQEQTIENLLINGLFSPERLPELKAYVESLDDDSVAPKLKLQGIVERMEEAQKRIAAMEAQAKAEQQRAMQFLMNDPDGQADQIADARRQLEAEEEAEEEFEGEEEYEEQEAELDEQIADEEAETDEE